MRLGGFRVVTCCLLIIAKNKENRSQAACTREEIKIKMCHLTNKTAFYLQELVLRKMNLERYGTI